MGQGDQELIQVRGGGGLELQSRQQECPRFWVCSKAEPTGPAEELELDVREGERSGEQRQCY